MGDIYAGRSQATPKGPEIVRTLIDRLLQWLWVRGLPVHEEITLRYRAIRGKSVAEFEQEILEELYARSEG
jgi:hypothetical protein